MKTIVRTLAVTGALFAATGAALAAGEAPHIERQKWSFSGPGGMYDKAQLQRGYQVYREVCSTCHGMNRLSFRNLVQKGGPEFPEEDMKAYAATYKVEDGPNDDGKMFQRPAKLSDRIPGPYKNDNEARSIHNGALPPDFSVIAKARNTHNDAPWYKHIFLMMRDVAVGYQEGGPDYIYALLTGYQDPPKNVKVADGMNYNIAFPGNQIAMVNPFAGGDGSVKYTKGPDGKPNAPETVDQYARDVSAFLAWAADPAHNQRKQTGWMVMLYLLVTSGLLYVAKKRIWAGAH